MHRRAFLLSAAALLVAPAACSADDSPTAFLAAIYRRVTAGKGDGGAPFMLTPEARPQYFSPRLAALWAAADARTKPDEVGPVDFDPIANSQDPLVRAFAIAVERRHATVAAVAVSLADKPGPVTPTRANTLHYTLVHEGGRWLIDDISGVAGGEAWDLRRMLESHGR
jgi:Protein of unknown function (DUF3828)